MPSRPPWSRGPGDGLCAAPGGRRLLVPWVGPAPGFGSGSADCGHIFRRCFCAASLHASSLARLEPRPVGLALNLAALRFLSGCCGSTRFEVISLYYNRLSPRPGVRPGVPPGGGAAPSPGGPAGLHRASSVIMKILSLQESWRYKMKIHIHPPPGFYN